MKVSTFPLYVLVGLLILAVATPPLGASGVCTDTSADARIDYVVWNDGVVSAGGDWLVNGASSARLQFYIDDVLFQDGNPDGNPGVWHPWPFGDNFDECGDHVFKVRVCPRVWDVNGYTVCETHCAKETASFTTYACLDVDYECSLQHGTNGVAGVAGEILAGDAPYKVETYSPSAWYTKYSSTYSTGPFTYSNRCSYPGYKVGMRITDAQGQVKTRFCPCALLQ